jgi:hypothetical protein
MTMDEVANLIVEIKEPLSPDDFLVVLATKAAEYAKSQWRGLSVSESEGLIAEYEDRPMELLEAAEEILRGRNTL